MKILFYLHSPATYHFDFFFKLKNNNEIYVIYENHSIKNFFWKFKKYKWVYFLKKKNPKKKIQNILKSITPDKLIIGGYNMKYESFFKINLNYKLFYWLERLNEKNVYKNLIRHLVLKFKLKNADGILAIGEDAKKYYEQYNDNVINLPYSIKTNRQNILKKKYKLNFLFVGQLIKRKGLEFLIDAISKINNISMNFTIVGSGHLKNKIKKIKNTNLIYYDFLNKEKLKKIYDKNSVLILPSIFDGWGVAIIEAMSRGLAIVSNQNVGAFNEYIKHNVNGREIKHSTKSIINEINFFFDYKNKMREYGIKNRKIFFKNLCNSSLAAIKLEKFLKNN